MPGTATQQRDQEYILKVCHDSNVRFIRLWFTDILGFLKSVAVTLPQFEDTLENGVSFDGSSIQGFARRDESDMVAFPDPNTFCLLPWRARDEGAVARMFCDILKPDGAPYEGDPRWVLKRTLQRAQKMGYQFYVGPELEFFYFKSAQGRPETLDEGGYFDLTPQDIATDIRRDTILCLEAMGIDVDFSHHEGAHSQHEIDLRYADALTMADHTMTYRLVVKEIAQKYGVYATFMPKPLQKQNGNGMHINTSLFRGSENLLYDPDDEYHLSKTARHYVAGLLKHIGEITLVLNQWVNSYKRLVPGYEAPVYISWALQNRSDLIRIPACRPGREEGTRVELRSPDPACNPYLAFAAILSAGLDGIEKEYPLPLPVERNVTELSAEERQRLGIESLPEDLYEAIKAAQQSELLQRVLGEHVFTKLIENKLMEWERYRAVVTDYELAEYLPIL
ncbi:MAG: glutamine synthetase [Armatimonadetes bacterium]|nr:glutamine synthetase [Armatimonadota bacterium]